VNTDGEKTDFQLKNTLHK